jgi:hypothetical protein
VTNVISTPVWVVKMTFVASRRFALASYPAAVDVRRSAGFVTAGLVGSADPGSDRFALPLARPAGDGLLGVPQVPPRRIRRERDADEPADGEHREQDRRQGLEAELLHDRQQEDPAAPSAMRTTPNMNPCAVLRSSVGNSSPLQSWNSDCCPIPAPAPNNTTLISEVKNVTSKKMKGTKAASCSTELQISSRVRLMRSISGM